MWGGLGLKSFSYWPQNSNPSTTQGFWHHWLFLHIRVLCCFSFLVLFFDIWVYKQKISLGSSMLLLSAPIHSPAVNVPVARCVGHTLQTWYWWEDEGVLDGKDACYIMVQAIFQPPWSGDVWHPWTSCSWDESYSDTLLIVGSGCLSGLYLPLCFIWKFAPCHVTIMFALGIIPFIQL